MNSETVHLDGHIIDSLTLSKVLDLIVAHGGEYVIRRFEVGATQADPSHVAIEIRADGSEGLDKILHDIGRHGAYRVEGTVRLAAAPADGVFPVGFHATTNLETSVRHEGKWREVDPIEMDCGIVIKTKPDGWSPICTPMHHVRAGDSVVIGDAGVRIKPVERVEPGDAFSFMAGDVSTERPKERIIEGIADAMRDARAQNRKVLFVGGPAIVHTDAGRHLEALIRAGWIDALFAGNALATHDIERALYGTSLGVDPQSGRPTAHGHEHHLRAINAIRAAGGIREAVRMGLLRSGIMHACAETDTPWVLAGSIRDDGPLPDVITDSLAAQDAMRAEVRGVGVALMVATTLHAIATGNLLSAEVRTVCVDSDADTVIKLMDRGSHQAFGLVTDCAYFLKELAQRLCSEEHQHGGAK